MTFKSENIPARECKIDWLTQKPKHMKLPLSPPPSVLMIPTLLAFGTLSASANGAQPAQANAKQPANPPGECLPPGLEKKDVLPPGLAKMDKLPPGLTKRCTSVEYRPNDCDNSRPARPTKPGRVVVRRIK